MSLLPLTFLPWLVLALVALVGWGVGRRAAGRRTPAIKPLVLSVHFRPAEAIPSGTLQHLRQRIGLALVRNQPEIDLRFVEASAPGALPIIVETADPDGGLVLHSGSAGRQAVLPQRFAVGPSVPGEPIAAWLLLHWPSPATTEAARELSRGHDTFDSLLIHAAASARLATVGTPASAAQRQTLREFLLAWPASASNEDRLRVVEMLATALITRPHAPATAVGAYEALDLANQLLTDHWAAGRTQEAAAAHHLLARIRLALGRAESEASHVLAAREAISHALAHGPRGGTRANRAADLALLGDIELAAAEHEPGTASLHRAAAASRESIGLTPSGSPDLSRPLGIAVAALTAIGEREAAPHRLENAVALARQAHRLAASEPTGTALARSLLALGRLMHRQTLVDEAAELAVASRTAATQLIRARALEARGRLSFDAGPLKEALQVWDDLALQTPEPLTATDRRLRAHCALTAARWSVEPELVDRAVDLARVIVAETVPSALTAALDLALLGEALLCRAEAKVADTAGAAEAIACFAEAIDRLGTEPLPQLKNRLETLRREAQRLEKRGNSRATGAAGEETPAPGVRPRPNSRIEDEPALEAIAEALEDHSATSEAQRLAQARHMLLVRLDRVAGESRDLVATPELDWLERIERAQQRYR